MAVIWVFAALLACLCGIIHATSVDVIMLDPTALAGTVASLHVKIEDAPTPLGGGTVKVGFVGFVPSEEEFAICTATTPKAAFSMAFSTASLPDSSRVNWVELTPVDALDSKSLVLTCTLRLPHLSRSMKVLVEWDGMEAVVVNAGLPAPAFILKNTVVRYNSNTRAPVADRTIRFEGRFSSPMDVPEAPTDFLFGIAGSTCMDPNKVQFAGGDRCTVYGSTTTYLTPSTKSDTYDGKHVLWFEPTNGMASVTGANLLTGPFEVLCPAVWVDCLDKDDSASETLDAFPVFKMKYDSGEVLIRAYPSAIFEALVDQEAKFEDDFHSGREFKELSTSASRIASYSFSLTEDGKSHYHHWTPLVAYSGLTVESDHFPPPLLVSLDHIGSISPQETGLFQGDFAIGAGNGFFNTEKISAHICIGSLDSSIPDSALDSELLELTQNPSYSLNDPGPDEKTISLESGAITHCVMHKEVFKGEDGKKLPLKLQAQNLANGKGISLHQHSGNVYSTFDASTHLVLTPGTFLRHTVLAKESLIGSSSSPFSFDKLVKPASVAPHPRPRLHQAIATSYSSSAKPSASSSSIEDYRSSGQLVFWYGGSTMVAPNAESSVLGDLWVHDVVADSWTLLFGSNDELNRENDERYSTATVPSARTGAALAYDADNALLWLFGGANIPVHRYETDNNAFYCSIWCFDLKTRSWAKRGTLDSNISGVAGASMVVRPNSGGKLVIVGGVMRRPSGDGASYGTNLMPVNTVLQFDPSTSEFEILSGTPYASNYSAPLPAAHDLASVSSIPAMAFHSVAWDPIPDGAGSDFLPGFYVFGGLHPTGPFRKMRPTNPHNSAHTSSDSDVLGTLYRYSFGANANGSEDSWLRVWPRPVVSSDTQSLIPASMNLPGYRGVPRYISSTPATSADNQPGGRVLAAMTVGSDGNVYVYGGRGHALSVRWPADSSSGELGLVPTMPFATAAFHGDTLTGVKIQCYFTCPVAQHVFVIPAAALTAAGLVKGDILRDLDVLLRASGQWITADAAGNGSSTAIAGVDTWIQLAEGAEFATADEIETAFRRMNIDSFRPAEPTDIIEAWQDGEFLSFSPRDLPKSPRNALVWDGVRGVTVSMRIRYSGLPASSDFTAAPYVPAQEGGNPPASAVVRDAHFNKCRSAMRFMFPGDATEHYVKFSDAVPEVILRTHLPPGLSSFPAAGSNPVAQPQLDDLWRYNVTAHRWELLGASRGRTVSYSDSSRTGARGQVGKDYSWPGGRVGAALVSPRLVIPGKTVSDIFLVGGFAALRSADDDAEQFMMNNDYASNKNPCDGLACVAYTDTWSLDVAASSSAVCARTASDMSASCSTSYDALVPVVPFVNAAAYGVHTAPAGPLDGDVCSAGDLCNGGQCRGLLSQYYCQCDDYVSSPTCSSSDSDINVAKNKLKLSIGLMSELALPLFPSVAVHPTKDITVVIGGKFLNADGSFTLSNNEFIFAGSASSSDTYSSVTIVIPGTPPTWGNIDNGIAPSEYQAAWFTRDGSRLCVLSPTPESGMAVWCKPGDDAATHGGYSLAGPDADALRETVTNESDTVHTEKCHADNVPALRQGFSSAVVGDRLCIFSGSGNVQGSVRHFDNIWCFDPTVDLWCVLDYGDDSVTEPVDGAAVTQGTFSPLVRPGPRHGAAIVASEDGKFLYLFGGAKPVSDPRSRLVPALMRDLLVYSFEKNEWAFLGGSRGPIENSDSSDALDQTIETLGRFSRLNAPGARAHASAAMVNGLLYIGYGVTATTTPSDTRGTFFATYPGALHDGGEPAPAWANIIPAGSTSAIGLEPAWALTRLPTDDQNNEAVLGKFGADSKARGYIFGAQFFARPTLFFGGKSGSLLAMASGVSLDAAAMYTTVEYPYYGLFSPQTLGFSPSIALLQTPCAANLCSAKGTKTCATTSKSIGFTPYDYVCECKTGFSGIHCEHPAGFADVNCARGSQFNHDQKKCVCGGDSRSVDSVCAPKFSSLKNVPVHHGHNGASTTALVIGAASASLFGDEVTDRSTMIFSMGGIVQEGIEIKGSSAVYAFDPVNYHSSVYFAGSGSDALHAPDYAAGIIGSRFGHSISHDYLTGDIFVFGGYALIGGEFTLTEDLWRIKIHDTGPATAAFIMSPSDRKGKKVPITVKSGALSMDEDTGHQWADNETVSGFPGARAFHNTFIAADSDGVSYLYVFGGVGADVDNNNGMLAGMWRIPLNSASGQEWTYVACSNKALPLNIGNGAKNAAVKDACPAARSRASFVASNNKAYLVGGVTENGPVSDLWVFSPETNTWTNTVPSGPTPGSAEVPVSMPSMEDSGPYHTGALTDTSCAPAPYPMPGVICYGGTQPVGPSKFMYRSGDPVLLPIKRSTLPALRFPFQPALEDGVLASLSTVLTKQAIADAGITDKAAFTHIGYKLWDASATSIDYKDMTLKASIAPSRSGSGIYIPIISELADFVVDLFKIFFNPQADKVFTSTNPVVTADGYLVFKIDNSILDERVAKGIVITLSGAPTGGAFQSLVYTRIASDGPDFEVSRSSTEFNVNYPTYLHTSSSSVFRSAFSPSLAVGSSFSDSRKPLGYVATSSARLFSASAEDGFLPIAGSRGNRPDLGQIPETLRGMSPTGDVTIASHYRGFGVGDGSTVSAFSSIQDSEPFQLKFDGAPPLSRAGLAVLTSLSTETSKPILTYVLVGGSYETALVAAAPNGDAYSSEGLDATFTPQLLKMPLHLNMEARFGGGVLEGSMPGVPVPAVSSAKFETSTTAIRIQFTAATNQPSLTKGASAANCNKIFVQASVDLFGSDPLCQWVNSATFRVSLGKNFAARVGSQLTLKGDVVSAAGYDIRMLSVSVALTANFALPVPVVNGPAEAGTCETVHFSALTSYGSIGMAFAYQWKLLSGNSSEEVQRVNTYLDSLVPFDSQTPFSSNTSPRNLPSFSLDMSLFDATAGPRLFELRITAWHSGVGRTEFPLQVHLGSVPTVAIAGAKNIVSPMNRNIIVNAELLPAAICGDMAPLEQQTLSYEWTLVATPPGVSPDSVQFGGSHASLRLRAYSLKPTQGSPYLFRVTVTSTLASGSEERSSSDMVSITVPDEPVRPVLRGGSGVYTTAVRVVIDGSESWDPMVNPATADPRKNLQHMWRCRTPSGSDCLTGDAAAKVNWNAPELVLSPEVLEAIRAGAAPAGGGPSKVTLTLRVARSGSDSWVSTSESVTLLSDMPYSLLIIAPNDPLHLDPTSPVTLTAVVTATNVTDIVDRARPAVVWVVDSNNYALSTSGALLPSSAPEMTLIDAQGGTYISSLRFPPGAIDANIELTIRASLFIDAPSAPVAVDPATGAPADLPAGPQNGEILSVTTMIKGNSAPSGGSCYPVFPAGADAAAGGKTFSLECSSWDDAEGNTPLRYQWLLRSRRVRGSEIEETLVEIGMPLPSPVLETSLEPGIEEDDYERRVVVVITDTLGAETTVEVAIPFVQSGSGSIAPAPPVLSQTAGFIAQAVPNGGLVFTPAAPLRALPTRARAFRGLAVDTRPHSSRADVPGRHSRVFAALSTAAPRAARVASKALDRVLNRALLPAPAQPRSVSLVNAVAPSATASSATKLDGLFSQLTAARATDEIRSVVQVALRISDVLEDTSNGLSIAQESAARVRLISALSAAFNLLTLSQDARRSAAATTDGASDGAFLALEGNSEIAIELLMQSCGDGSLLGGEERANTLRFLLSQMAELTAFDKVLGVAPRTVDTAAGLLGSVVGSFSSSIGLINPNATLPASGTEPSVEDDQAALVKAVAEAKRTANLLATQINVAEIARSRKQMLGANIAPVARNGITTLSLPVSVEDIPASVSAPVGGSSSGSVSVALPQWALKALGPRELQVVLGVVENPDLLLLAGLDDAGAAAAAPGEAKEGTGHLNATRSSALVSLTVFNRDNTAFNTDVPVSDGGFTIPVPKSEVFALPREALDLGGYVADVKPLAGFGASRPLSASYDFSAPRGGSGGVNDTEAFEFTIPHEAPTWHDVTFSCEWWQPAEDGNGGSWSTDGCVLVSTASDNSTTVCRCVHLTMFRVRMSLNDMIPRFNTIKPSDFLNLTVANIREHPVPLIVCLVWFGVYVLFFFLGAWIDKRKDARALRKYHNEWRPTAESAAATAAAIKALKDEDRRVGFCGRWWLQLKYSIRHDHMWLSVFLRDDTNAFSSTGRVTAAFVLILTGYMINAIFFGTAMGFGTIIKSLCAAVIILPVGMFMIVLFHHTQQGRIKDALYAYAEHLAFLKWTGRDADPEFAGKMEHQLRANPDIPSENIVPMLASIASSAGWQVGPGNAHVLAEHRGKRDELALRGKLRLLVHVDYDFLLVWYQQWTWRNSFPRGIRLVGYVLLWIWILACVMLILVYGMQFDLVEGSSTAAWLQSSAISNALEIFIFKPLFVPFRVFCCLGLAALCCAPAPCLPTRTSKDDALTVFESWEIHSDATGTCKTTVGDGGVGLELDVGNDAEDEAAMDAANRAAAAKYHASQERVLVAAPAPPTASSSSLASAPPPPAARSAAPVMGVSSSGTPLPPPGPRSHASHRPPPLLSSSSSAGAAAGAGAAGGEMEMAPMNLSSPFAGAATTIGEEDDDYDDGLPLGARAGGFDD